METVSSIILLAGATLILIAAIGVIRFPDVYARMHAAAKAPALAILLMGMGTSLAVRTAEAVITCSLVVILQLIAGPVGAHLLSRSVYLTSRPPLNGPDELAEADRIAAKTPRDGYGE